MYIISVVGVGNFSEESGYPSSITTPLPIGVHGQAKYKEADVASRHDLTPGEGWTV